MWWSTEPPEESTHDVEKSLDALLKVLRRHPLHPALFKNGRCVSKLEESKEKEAEDQAVSAKQRMLNIDKQKMR